MQQTIEAAVCVMAAFYITMAWAFFEAARQRTAEARTFLGGGYYLLLSLRWPVYLLRAAALHRAQRRAGRLPR